MSKETKCSSATDHIWSKRCDFLQGTGAHYICERCGHSNTYLRLRVTEKEALESTRRPYFTIEEQGWSGKFQAGEAVELDISELVNGSPGRLNWERIPPKGFPVTFTCEHMLFWSESLERCWLGSIVSGDVQIRVRFSSTEYRSDISHFAVFTPPGSEIFPFPEGPVHDHFC